MFKGESIVLWMYQEEQSMSNKNLLKNAQGAYLTNGLFYELQNKLTQQDITPSFTLKERDIVRNGKKLPSLKKIYMSYVHAPYFEYEFAMDTFGEWEHWERIATSFSIKDHVQKWRDEMTVKLKASAIQQMIKESVVQGTPSALQAAKYVASLGWEVKAGRPSKAEVNKQAKVAAGVRDTLNSDMERLGLTVVEK